MATSTPQPLTAEQETQLTELQAQRDAAAAYEAEQERKARLARVAPISAVVGNDAWNEIVETIRDNIATQEPAVVQFLSQALIVMDHTGAQITRLVAELQPAKT